MKKTKEMDDVLKELEDGITNMMNSADYKRYLHCMSKFHSYSWSNNLLIMLQKPDATHVAGYNTWKSMNRYVRKGESALRIMAPAPYKVDTKVLDKDDNGNVKLDANGNKIYINKKITIPNFKMVNVFDISQTDGEEIPDLGCDELHGNSDEYNSMFNTFCKIAPVPVVCEEITNGAKGYFDDSAHKIAIKQDCDDLQKLKTVIHEIAHSMMHNHTDGLYCNADRQTKEVQAESVAYAVCDHYGIDTSDYSFGYITGWSGARKFDEIKTSLDAIRKTADKIITKFDKEIAVESASVVSA